MYFKIKRLQEASLIMKPLISFNTYFIILKTELYKVLMIYFNHRCFQMATVFKNKFGLIKVLFVFVFEFYFNRDISI